MYNEDIGTLMETLAGIQRNLVLFENSDIPKESVFKLYYFFLLLNSIIKIVVVVI